MTAGYSKRSLADKLGIKPGSRIVALGAPTDYAKLLAPWTTTERPGSPGPRKRRA
ncbi:MAG TPA: hypothetical protein VH763_10775 [Gemmatimonadales bacterium]|jgi:hypothetical protein